MSAKMYGPFREGPVGFVPILWLSRCGIYKSFESRCARSAVSQRGIICACSCLIDTLSIKKAIEINKRIKSLVRKLEGCEVAAKTAEWTWGKFWNFISTTGKGTFCIENPPKPPQSEILHIQQKALLRRKQDPLIDDKEFLDRRPRVCYKVFKGFFAPCSWQKKILERCHWLIASTVHIVTKIGRTFASCGKSRWGFGQVKWCPWSLKGRKCCEVARLSESRKRSSRWLHPASSEICSREMLTMVFMGKKWKLSWSLEKGEGHLRGQLWISLQGSGADQRPVAQSQYLDAVPCLLQVRWYQFKKHKQIKEHHLLYYRREMENNQDV